MPLFFESTMPPTPLAYRTASSRNVWRHHAATTSLTNLLRRYCPGEDGFLISVLAAKGIAHPARFYLCGASRVFPARIRGNFAIDFSSTNGAAIRRGSSGKRCSPTSAISHTLL